MDCSVCGHYNNYNSSNVRNIVLICREYEDASQKGNVMMRTCEYCGMMNHIDVQYCNHCLHDVWEKPPERSYSYNGGNSYVYRPDNESNREMELIMIKLLKKTIENKS